MVVIFTLCVIFFINQKTAYEMRISDWSSVVCSSDLALAEQKADIMYRVDRNNFYQNEKKATVCTPDYVSEFLFSIISPHIKKGGLVVDPCVGEGALLLPWQREGYKTLGIDIEDQGFPNTIEKNYLE